MRVDIRWLIYIQAFALFRSIYMRILEMIVTS